MDSQAFTSGTRRHRAGSRAAEIWGRFVEGERGGLPYPILFIIGYFLLQALLLTLTRNGASFDGAEQLITSQALEWGYGRSQPPLYTWLLVFLDQFVPAPLMAEHILKACLFITGFSAIYATARQIGLGKSASALAMLCTFLLPEIGWQAQTAYTHSTLIFATGALLLYAFSTMSPESGLLHHCILGFLAGLAILSKFSAAYLIAAMFVALAIEGQLRSVFLKKRALAGLIVLLLVVGPHAIWSINHPDLLFALKGRFELDAYTNPVIARAVGLLNYLLAVVIFLGLPALVSGIAAGWPWRFLRSMTAGEKRVHAVFIASIAIMALTPILSGGADFAPRWPLAALFFYGLLVASFLERIRPGNIAKVGAFTIVVAVAFLLAMNLRSSLPGSRFENDYRILLSQIEQRTGPIESVVIDDYPVLANLRLARPALRLVMDEFPFTERFRNERSVYLWTSEGAMPESLKAQARKEGRDPTRFVWIEVPMVDSYGNKTGTIVRAAF